MKNNKSMEIKMKSKTISKTKKSIIIQTIIAFSLCLILVVALIFQFTHLYELRTKQTELQQTLSQLQDQNAMYSDQLEYFQSPDYIEDIAREQNKGNPNVDYY